MKNPTSWIWQLFGALGRGDAAATTLPDGVPTIVRVVRVQLAEAAVGGLPGFTLTLAAGDGTVAVHLPCDPLPAGGDQVRPGRLVRIVAFGGIVAEVTPLEAGRVASAA